MKRLILLLAAALPAQTNFPNERGYATLKDGARLAYVAWRPTAEGRFPVLLIYNMYDASAITPDFNQTQTSEIREYLERGYAVAGVNARGTGCSTGVADVLHAAVIGRDGAEFVEWIAKRSWSNGNVGMFGHSGSGLTQFFVAAEQPPSLKAVIPGAAPVDFYRDLGYPGGLFNYAFIYHWSVDAQPASETRAARVHMEAGDTGCDEWRKVRKSGPTTFEGMSSHPLKDQWWIERSPETVASRIRTPTYIVFGWQDQNVDSRAIEIFDQLQGPKRMVLSEEEHSMYIRNMEVRREKLRFFDHWLKGVQNGVMDGPPIRVWYSHMGAVERIPGRTGRYTRVPPANTNWTRLFLRADGRLSEKVSGDEASRKYLYPLGTAFAYGGTTHPHVPFGLGSLRFLTDAFTEEKALLGPSMLWLFASSTEADTAFQIVINVINERGDRKYLQRAYLKASMREIDKEASRSRTPVHTFRSPRPIKPGEITEFVMVTNMTGTIVPAGSRLELILMAPNIAPEPIGQWGFLPLPMATNTVQMWVKHPSSLMLPFQPDKP
ncbi:MAG: CocE/NonD family hydrolase [Bryobacteraceae bacterium]